MIHRDIKPSNILLGDRSGDFVGDVFLVDFGAVQTIDTQGKHTMTIVGTYGYMPPEQFGGRSSPASDLYSNWLQVPLYSGYFDNPQDIESCKIFKSLIFQHK